MSIYLNKKLGCYFALVTIFTILNIFKKCINTKLQLICIVNTESNNFSVNSLLTRFFMNVMPVLYASKSHKCKKDLSSSNRFSFSPQLCRH